MSAPYPSEAPTVSQPTSAASQTTPAPEPPTGAPHPPSAMRQRVPGLNRRVMALVATLYMPVILLCYALYLFGPTTCVAGPLCSVGDAPALAQVMLLVAVFVLLYFISVRPLAAALDERQPPHSELIRALRLIVRFETLRPLLAGLGGLIAAALLVGAIMRTLTLPAFALGAGMAALFFWLAATSEP